MAALSATSLQGVPKAKTDLLGKKHCALWSGKKKKKKKNHLSRVCTPHTGNTFWVSRKDDCGVHASGCPKTGRLMCWISKGDFVEVIT